MLQYGSLLSRYQLHPTKHFSSRINFFLTYLTYNNFSHINSSRTVLGKFYSEEFHVTAHLQSSRQDLLVDFQHQCTIVRCYSDDKLICT